MRIDPRFLPLAFVAAGCATEEAVRPAAAVAEPEPPPYVAQVNAIATAAPAARIDRPAYRQVIMDGFAAQSVVVDDVRRSRTNDGYERIQVLVKNVTAAAMRVRWRFDWQDAQGVVVDDPDHAAWEKTTLAPGDDGVFTSIAPRKDCADFRLRMKLVQ